MVKAEAVATRKESPPVATPPEVRLLTDLKEFEDAVEVIGRVWGRSGGALLPVELLRAYAYSGNPVIGAFAPGSGEMIGICLGFLAAPDADDLHLHSHMTGVVPGTEHRGIGFALKCRQRDWCLERGISDVRWTVDPILAANAWFNIQKLGATAHTYLPEFYGEMGDDLNRGEVTDRLEMTWSVASERVAAVLAGNSPNGRVPERTVAVPADYRQVRQDDPALAAKLRLEVREGLMSAFDDGLEISGFSRERGYLLSPRA